MGLIKGNIDAVAVYYADKQAKKFKKSSKFFITSNASVFTVNDKVSKKPKLFPVKATTKDNKEISYQLVQIAFNYPDDTR